MAGSFTLLEHNAYAQGNQIPAGCPGSNLQGPRAPGVTCPGNIEADCDGGDLSPENCGITSYIRLFTDALSVLVGIVVVMMIVIGGIQYSAAGANPQAVAAAKKRISQALIALVMYIFTFAFLQWLVPGGVF